VLEKVPFPIVKMRRGEKKHLSVFCTERLWGAEAQGGTGQQEKKICCRETVHDQGGKEKSRHGK